MPCLQWKKIRKLAQGKNKCNKILNDEYGKKLYFCEKNINEARKFYKMRVQMLPFAENFKHDKRFYKSGWLCKCGSKEDENHLMSGACPVYSDLISPNMDFSLDEHLVILFTDNLRRKELTSGNVSSTCQKKLKRTGQIKKSQMRSYEAIIQPKCAGHLAR